MSSEFLNGSGYFVLFIDGFSRYCWVYFMKHKSNAFNLFVQFKAMVETDSDKKIKVLILNNGAEYCSRTYQNFSQLHGIQH